jgi:hypothetical protein
MTHGQPLSINARHRASYRIPPATERYGRGRILTAENSSAFVKSKIERYAVPNLNAHRVGVQDS